MRSTPSNFLRSSRLFLLVLLVLWQWSQLATAQTYLASEGATYSTCAGVFYDTGGPSGNYGNGQNITTTICPTGGAGAGPQTSVTFTQWQVAGGPGDRLFIYNGTSAADPLLATGTSANSLLNQSFTSTHASGCLTFRFESDGSGVSAGWAARITTGPDAGTNASITVCTSAPAFNMRPQLGGTPDAGGAWTAPGGSPHPNTFDPAVDAAGVYTYTVIGPAPCPDSLATLTITKVTASSAGSNGNLVLCSNSAPASLLAALGGSPTSGGSWSGPNGVHSGTFNAATDPAGAYTYTVTGTPPCASATATVNVTVNTLPNAGQSASVSVCSNSPAFSLSATLGGSPQSGGVWTGPGGGAVSATYTPGSSTPGVYTYTVVGLPPCPSATATVTVTQVAAPNAGANRSITVCSTDAPFAMLGQLAGTPSAGGTWVGPNGPQGVTFDPANDVGGAYTYTVQGTIPCENASAVLTITLRAAPNAGTSASITVCNTDGSFPLIGVLGGAPNAGGSWTAPGGGAFGGTFVPGASAPGTYTYTVTGQAPCIPASSTVTVSVNTAPNAGTNASVTRCSNAPSFLLFAQLGGSPNAGGTWTGPGGVASNGTFMPGTSTPGAYVYTVLGQAPCANAQATVTVAIVQAPTAGANGSITVCSDQASFALIASLGGTPDPAGTWTAPGGSPSNGTFVPGTSPAGVYTYTVSGQSPCTNAQATVTVNVVQAPNAGTNGSLTVCSNSANVNLFPLLGGTPQSGGTWTTPAGGVHTGTYLPATQAGGTYTYTVNGTTPCANASASVQVVRVVAPNAGTDGVITVCSTNSPFPLINVLGGSPGGTGSWINSGGTSASGTFTPGTTPAGVYRYVVPGTVPCSNDTSQVTVNVNMAPNAGQNASLTVCSDAAAFPLFEQLGGSPNTGGTWTTPGGTAYIGTFTPGQSVPGGYTYSVPGQTPCLNASAVVVVSVNPAPNAGTGGAFQRCSTDPPVDLFTLLGGAPQTGGTWTGPSGPTTGLFIPGTGPSGNYTYTVAGTAPCVNATATLVATVNQAPNAGTSGSLTVCNDQGVVNLFTGLGGDPDANGIWTNSGGQTVPQFFNPVGLPSGTYPFTYTVPGIGQCVQAVSTVQVTVVGLLSAGTSGTMTVCGSNAQVNLFNGLGGAPQVGGHWLDLSGTGALSGNLFNATLVGAGLYVFRYRLVGSVACASDSAQTSVTVVTAPNAGTNAQVTVCSNGESFSMFPLLGGSPTSGGTWYSGSINGPVVPSTYDPVLNAPGTFFYVVNGTGPCPNASASVTVNEVPAPNAGTSAAITVCRNGAPFNMTQLLGGNPQPGSWFFGGVAHSNIFVPGLDIQGIYVYVVQGQAPFCVNATSTLTISAVPEANAGTNGSSTVCSTDPQFLLITVLGGTPAFNGTWIPSLPGGAYTPGTSPPGEYLYVVAGSGPCANDTAVVSIFENPAPNAGLPGNLTLCAGGAAVQLITALGGSPSTSGTWVGPAPGNPPFSGTFVPGTTPAGVYIYSVSGAFPCPASASATVTVAVNQPSQAGFSNSITRCSNDAGFAMVGQLLGTPALNGSWVGPAPSNPPSNGLFIPGTSAPGLYTYTVQGSAPCPSASATLNIIVNPQANAGANANLAICSNSGAQPMLPVLGPNAQPGGIWTYQPTGASHSGTFLPSVDLPGTYVYTVPGLPGCNSATALVNVVVNQSPNAGSNGLVTICNTQDPFLLIGALGGSPQSNGSWTGPSGAHTGIFVPSQDPAGLYIYTIQGAPPCSSATAQVTVIKNIAPDAGGNGVVTVCSDQAAFQLFTQLTGLPDADGVWIGPGNLPSNGTYVPGTTTPGVYKYLTVGTAPCVSDSALVTVIEYVAPVAGFNSTALLCSNSGPQLLLDLLNGQPATNGSWTYNGETHNPVFNPAMDLPGAYLYTVEGQTPCPNALAQVQITLVSAPSAGVSGALTVCLDDPSVQLFDGLGSNWDAGGSWEDVSGTGQLNGSLLNATWLPPGGYPFIYTVPGLGPCPEAMATVAVNITPTLSAGADTLIQACESEPAFLLFERLTGEAQVGGTWIDIDQSGALLGGVFNPALAGEGMWRFDYVLAASASCPADTARLTVEVLDGPYAGCNGASTQCRNFAPFQLATALGCGHDPGGQWFRPDWTPMVTGTFLPATDAPGAYHYVVAGVGNCATDTSVVVMQVVEAPNAGNDVNVSICSTDGLVGLFDLLGPNAQPLGTWIYVTGGNVQHSGFYNPAVDSPGTYQYRVQGLPPCSEDFAFVQVTEPQAPNAGCNALAVFCSSQDPVNMRLELGCSPQAGGSWTGPSSTPGGFFDPASQEGGVYTYTVTGTAPCPSATATLTVSVVQAADAGQSGSVAACVTQSSVDLFAALGPQAQSGGLWLDSNTSGALSGNLFDPSVAGVGNWAFQYAIAANGPCAGTASQIVVNVTEGLSAGENSVATICGGSTAFPLITAVNGDPDPGGIWIDQLGTGALLPGGLLNASLLPPGTVAGFTYQLSDPGCGAVSSDLLITISEYPDPGQGGSFERCVTDANVDLFTLLSGNPETGGVWTDPLGSVHSGTFLPASDPSGAYAYTLSGNVACPDTAALVVMQAFNLPDAGRDGELLACDTIPALELFAGLNGSPQSGGVWSDLDGSGGLDPNGVLSTTLIAAGVFEYQYLVNVQACGRDSARVQVRIVDGVYITDEQRICDERNRTYTVSFTIWQGDVGSYVVEGLPGSIASAALSVFTSDPIPTSAAYEAFVHDQYGCSVVRVAGVSPCTFNDDVFVPQTFSPNGDGVNDWLVIPGIEGFPGNSITIFNRWGGTMYEAGGYNNRSVVWDGSSSDGSYAGTAPAGTYFYVLDLGHGKEAYTGYIYLNR